MAIELNGTTGITTPGLTNTGTETIVNLTTTGNTILGDASTDTLNVGNGGLIKDASGNVGIGVTPSAWGVFRSFDINSSTNPAAISTGGTMAITSNGFYNGTAWIYKNTTTASLYQQQSGAHQWYIAPSGTAGNAITFTQAMTLDASGNLFVGMTPGGSYNSMSYSLNVENGIAQFSHISGTVSTTNYINFNYNAGSIGSISQNGTTSVAYNTTSDYRLKTDVTPIQDALSTITALNPVSFTWVDGRPDDGFIAHELQEILPNCVTGEKDAVDDEGNPKYQQMDNSGVVPFLVKAIQEQQAMIDELKAKVAALEAA